MLVKSNHIKTYMLEKCVNNPERGVGLRRKLIAAESDLTKALTGLPYVGYDYSKVRRTTIGKKKQLFRDAYRINSVKMSF